MTHAAPPQPPLAPPGPPMSSGKAKRPFYKRKLVWLLGIVVLIIVIIAVNSSKSSTTAPAATDSGSSAPAAAPEAAAAEPGVGTSVRDGKFEFVVTSVEPGTPSIGEAPLTTKAQGQFVLVNVSVTNIGTEPQAFSGSDTKAFDSQGREFTASTSAAIYLPSSNSLYTPINPGNKVDGKVVFDVPVGTALTSIELHDSAFSGGVTVKL